MDKSELLFRAVARLLFFEELNLDTLCYMPVDKEDPDLPDLIVNLGNTMLAAKLEIRSEADGKPGADGEDPWLKEIYAAGRIALRKTLSRILDRSLPAYRNPQGQPLVLSEKVAAFPVLVLDNGGVEADYPRLLEKYTPEGVIANCMTYSDFEEICSRMAVPMGILHFLYYRACYYADLKTVTSSFADKKDGLGRILPIADGEMADRFLKERFGYTEANREKFHFEELRAFLKELPHRARHPEQIPDVIRFITHMARDEMAEFVERLNVLEAETRRGGRGLLSSLRPKDYQYAVFFVSRDAFPLDVLRQMIEGCDGLKDVMEIVGQVNPDGSFCYDFVLADNF